MSQKIAESYSQSDKTHAVSRKSSEQGYSITELLVVLALLSILSLLAVPNLAALRDPLDLSQEELLGHLKQVRAKAIATTSSYTVYPNTDNSLQVVSSAGCGGAATGVEMDLQLTLQPGISFNNTDWLVCFSPTGFAETNEEFVIEDPDGRTASLEVFLGGAVRLQ